MEGFYRFSVHLILFLFLTENQVAKNGAFYKICDPLLQLVLFYKHSESIGSFVKNFFE